MDKGAASLTRCVRATLRGIVRGSEPAAVDEEKQPMLPRITVSEAEAEFPKRYILAVLAHVGLLISYLMRVNLSVAINELDHAPSERGVALCPFMLSSVKEGNDGPP